MKSDMEKMRDTMEYIHGSNTGLRYSGASRDGADMAARARGPALPKYPQPGPKSVIPPPPGMTPHPAPAGSGTVSWVLAILVVLGAWLGYTQVGNDVANPTVRVIVGASAVPIVAGMAIGVLNFVIESLIPALIRLAIIAAAVYLVYLSLSGQL